MKRISYLVPILSLAALLTCSCTSADEDVTPPSQGASQPPPTVGSRPPVKPDLPPKEEKPAPPPAPVTQNTDSGKLPPGITPTPGSRNVPTLLPPDEGSYMQTPFPVTPGIDDSDLTPPLSL